MNTYSNTQCQEVEESLKSHANEAEKDRCMEKDRGLRGGDTKMTDQ